MIVRIHRRVAGAGLVAVLLLGAACGTRLEKSDIVAAHDGAGGGQELAAGRGSGGSDLTPAAGGTGEAGLAAPADGGPTPAAAVPSPAAGPSASGAATPSGAGGPAGPARPATAAAPAAAAAGQPGAAPAAGGPAAAGPAPGGGNPAAAGGPAAPAPAPAPGAANGAPIVVGAVGQTSGIVGAAVGPALPALQAWAASVNATGGINGHPVKLVFGDDGGDPARHRQLVQQLVERDGVVAFVMHFTPLAGQSSVDYLTQKRIPVTGDSGAGQWFYESPMFFPQMSTGAVWVKAMINAAASETVPQGKKKLAILNCQEAQFCVDADRLWPGLAPKVGYDLVFRRQASLAQPDYTAECLGARNAGAEVFGLAMDGNAIGRIANACARVDFFPIYFIHHSALLLEHAEDPNVNGIIVPLPTRPWFDNTNPVVAAYQKALATYAPGQEAKSPSFAGWAAAQQFQAAAKLAPDPTTSQGILEGLWALNGDTYGDISYPHTFSREEKATEVLCYYIVRGAEGKFATTDRGKSLQCQP